MRLIGASFANTCRRDNNELAEDWSLTLRRRARIGCCSGSHEVWGSVCESRSFFQCSEEAGRYFWRKASIPAAACPADVSKFELLSHPRVRNDGGSRHQIGDGKEAER